MDLFSENKVYFLQEIIDICNKNDLIVVDCLKDENIISIEKYNDGELGDCIYEFRKIKEDLFKLVYIDKFLVTDT